MVKMKYIVYHCVLLVTVFKISFVDIWGVFIVVCMSAKFDVLKCKSFLITLINLANHWQICLKFSLKNVLLLLRKRMICAIFDCSKYPWSC